MLLETEAECIARASSSAPRVQVGARGMGLWNVSRGGTRSLPAALPKLRRVFSVKGWLSGLGDAVAHCLPQTQKVGREGPGEEMTQAESPQKDHLSWPWPRQKSPVT